MLQKTGKFEAIKQKQQQQVPFTFTVKMKTTWLKYHGTSMMELLSCNVHLLVLSFTRVYH